MYSPTLELGKREGQLPLLQAPIAHSAWQLSWVLELAKTTEHKRSTSANAKSLHISGEKLVSSLVQNNQPTTEQPTNQPTHKLPLYDINHDIKSPVKCHKDLPPDLLLFTSTAPKARCIKTFANQDLQQKYIQRQDRLTRTHGFGFGYWHNLGKHNRILVL